MAFLPNNSTSSTSISSGYVTFQDGVLITNDPAYTASFPAEYVSEWVRVSGLPKITVQAEGTNDGSAPTYPDSANIGQVLIGVEVANTNSAEFVGGSALSVIRIGEYTCALTSSATFTPPPLYQEFYNVGSKFARLRVTTGQDPAPTNFIAKLYVRIVASC